MLRDLMVMALRTEFRERLPVIDFQYEEERERRTIRLVKVEGQYVWGMEKSKNGYKCVRFNRNRIKSVWFGEFDSDLLQKVLTSGEG